MARHDMRGVKETPASDKDKEKQSEDVGFFGKLKQLSHKLKLGPHHRMERFTFMLTATLCALVFFTAVSYANHRSDVSNLASSQAMFTEEFTYSLSGNRGKIEGVFGDEHNTDVMVLFQMNDPSAMSSNADNYEMFITGDGFSVDSETAPDMSYSLFGTTGYGMVRFQSPDGEPIEPRILNVTIRSNTTLADGGMGAVERDDGVVDESFDDYDQAQFYVNPGALNVETADGLEAGETNASRIYAALVAAESEAEVMDDIESTTSELRTLLSRAEEYTSRIENAGYIAPETPWFMAGDSVDSDGVFKPDTVMSRGHDFDYWNNDIFDGYIGQVVDTYAEFDEYMNERSAANTNIEEARETDRRETVERIDVLEDDSGNTLDLNSIITGSSPSDQVAVKDAAESLVNTWRSYLNEKSKFQREQLGDLLLLDADVLSQADSYSVNDSEDVVTFY